MVYTLWWWGVKIHKLIEANLFVDSFGTREEIDSLIDQALYHRINKPDMMAWSNEGCWRSEFKYKEHDWLINNLMTRVDKLISYYIQQDPSYIPKVGMYGNPKITYWTNVNEPGSKNVLHTHDLHHYVSCYYLQTDGTGSISFHNPANLLENCHPCSPFVSRMVYTPKDSDILLWPGWMPHETETNTSDKQRINIAFNVQFETPRGTAR